MYILYAGYIYMSHISIGTHTVQIMAVVTK